MSESRSPQLEVLFEQAVGLPPEERTAFVREACGHDERLRRDLTSLVASYEASCEFFERLGREVLAPTLAAVAEEPDDDVPVSDPTFPYQVLERLGAGGMGVVYKAIDLRLGRAVALKFLPGHLTGDATAKTRLQAEAQAASTLDSPNIGVIHEIGETRDGRLFIVMAYYEGQTLQQKIAAGPVPLGESIGLAMQVTRALASVHRRSIVHRDVKPSNILVTSDGVVKLLDFGIAKASGGDVTRDGPTPGTIGYMSPEQTRGERVDARTDLWSVGVVLHEMLTGRRPFLRDNDQATIYAIRNDPWHDAACSAPPLPRGLEKVIRRCLEKDRELRYARAEDLLNDLEALAATSSSGLASPLRAMSLPRIAKGAAALLIVLLGGALLRPTSGDDPSRSDVPPSTAAGLLAAEATDSDAHTLYLTGRYFLDKRDEESTRKALDYFRRALDADPTYARAWAGWADAHKVMAWLTLMPPQEAYSRVRAAATRALELDPGLAEAHVSLATVLSEFDLDLETAARHTRRAIELDPASAAARRQHAVFLRTWRRFDEALDELRTARELDPLWRTNQQELGVTLFMAGRYDEALAAFDRSLESAPDDLSTYFFIAAVRREQGRYDEALAALDRARPTGRWQSAETLRAYIYAVSGREAEARARLTALDELARTEYVSPWHPAIVHLGLGEIEHALDLLEQAYEQRGRELRLLPVEPIFNPIRSHPRFVALVEKVRGQELPLVGGPVGAAESPDVTAVSGAP